MIMENVGIDIHKLVDREIVENRLHPQCAFEAEQESNGNHHLKIAMYVIKRVEMLEREMKQREAMQSLTARAEEALEERVSAKSPDPEAEKVTLRKRDALEARKTQSVVPLVKYKCKVVSSKKAPSLVREKKKKVLFAIIGNVGLVIGVLGAVFSKWILGGGTLFNISYAAVAFIVAAILIVPLICSKINIKKYRLSYANALFMFCLLSSAVSAKYGIKLLKTDPSNYSEMADEKKKQNESVGDKKEKQYVTVSDVY